jgi:copper homeostasis protein
MHLPANISLEICVDTWDDALAAQEAGASRIELCAALSEGGITPYHSLMVKACSSLKIPVHVMIRPRAGDFIYSASEFELMKDDISLAMQLGASGVVFGILNNDGTIDRKRVEILTAMARPMKVTFHRAFDMTADPFFSMEEIIAIGIDYILTSGQHQSAEDGLEVLRELVKRSMQRISIIAAGGISDANCLLLHEAGIREFHFSSRKKVNSPMTFRNEVLLQMGSSSAASEYERYQFNEGKIISIIKLLSAKL